VYGKRSESIRLVLGTFGVRCWVPYAFRTPRMDLEHDECFPNMNVGVLGANGPYSGSIRSIRKPFGVFENHSETILKHSESKRKSSGDTLMTFGVINIFGGKFG
jgi:hypothetical protein